LVCLALVGDADVRNVRELLSSDYDKTVAQSVASGLVSAEDARIAMHPLLRAFLLTRLHEQPLSQTLSRVRAIVPRLARSGAWDQALAVLEQFPDGDLILTTLKNALGGMLAAGRVTTVDRWARLAREARLSDPILLLAEAEVALRRREELRAQTLAERAAKLIGHGDAAARAHLTAARAAHLREDVAAAERNGLEAAALAESSELRRDALWVAYLRAFEDEDPQARDLLEDLAKLSDESSEDAVRLAAARAVLALEADRDPRAAIAICEEVAALLADIHDPFTHTNFLNAFASASTVLAEFERVLELTTEEAAVAHRNGLDFVLDHVSNARARAFIGLRKLSLARRVIRELQGRTVSASDFIVLGTTLNEAKLCVALGDLRKAAATLEHDSRLAPPTMRSEVIAYRALVAAALGEIHVTRRAVAEARSISQYVDPTAACDLAEAIASLQSNGDEQAAATQLESAIDAGHLEPVVTACRAFPPLVAIWAKHKRTAAALTELLTRSRDADIGRQAGLTMPRRLVRGASLTPREQDVYELLVQGRTNQEIATALFISESTTKVHVRHIFEKLDVRSRAEAAGLSLGRED
jgi:DNA-binding CsgD family transcriptional regulator